MLEVGNVKSNVDVNGKDLDVQGVVRRISITGETMCQLPSPADLSPTESMLSIHMLLDIELDIGLAQGSAMSA